MKQKSSINRAAFLVSVCLILCFAGQAIPGGVIANRNSDINSISAAGLEKAMKKLNIVYFTTTPGLKLACTDSATTINGTRYVCNRGGFGNSLPLLTYTFTARTHKFVKDGKTSWEKLIKSVLDNPGNRHFNTIVCPGSKAGKDADKATAEYLQFMSKLEGKYSGKIFVYMTGALNNTRIREFCRANSKILLDSADLSKNMAQAEWYLWARIAEGAEGGSGVYSGKPGDSVQGKSFKQLIADAKQADKKGQRVEAYINYKEALKRAKASKDIRETYSKDLINARTRIFALELFPKVKKEKEAWDAHDRSASDIKSNLERAKKILEDTAGKYPDTYSGKRAKETAQELKQFIEKL